MKKNKAFKSVGLFLLAIFTVLIPSFPVDAGNTDLREIDEQYVGVPIITVDDDADEEEIHQLVQELFESQEQDLSRNTRAQTARSFVGVRSGTTQNVTLIFNWAGTSNTLSHRFNAWRYSTITVSNTSSISPVVYGRFGQATGATTNMTMIPIHQGAISGTATVGNLLVPTAVNLVRINAVNIQGYSTTISSWVGFGNCNTTGTC